MTKYSTHTEAERLLALSEKAGRIAESLAEIALEGDSAERKNPSSDLNLAGETVDWLIRARRERARYVPVGLFEEPVWDTILQLLQAEIAEKGVCVSDACLATGLPEEIGRRWLNAMVENRLVTLRKVPNTGDEVVELTPEVSSAVRRYLRDVVEER